MKLMYVPQLHANSSEVPNSRLPTQSLKLDKEFTEGTMSVAQRIKAPKSTPNLDFRLDERHPRSPRNTSIIQVTKPIANKELYTNRTLLHPDIYNRRACLYLS